MHMMLLQEKGTCDKDFWICVLLTILGWLPGYAALAVLHEACAISVLWMNLRCIVF